MAAAVDPSLYKDLTNGLNVEVKFISSIKGKGLFATTSFEESDDILKENPMVCTQFLWNEFYNYTACEFCLKSLESAEEMARRLTANHNIVLPRKEYCTINADSYVQCPQCQVVYCSSSCLEKAINQYHKLLCLGPHVHNAEHPINKLRETWKNMHYPPETSSIMLIAKMIAMVEQSENPVNTLRLFSQFSHVTVNNEATVAHKLLGEKFEEQIELLRLQLINAMTSEKIREWYTPGGIRSLLAMIGTNGQGIASSQYVRKIDATEFTEDEEKYLDAFLDQLYLDMHQESGEFLDCEGSGLYVLQSCCNHSCEPNAEIHFLDNNATLTLKAIRNIKSGQEITISYIDSEIKSWKKRRSLLMENYLFECTCDRCTRECQYPELVSSDSDSEENDMEVDDGDYD